LTTLLPPPLSIYLLFQIVGIQKPLPHPFMLLGQRNLHVPLCQIPDNGTFIFGIHTVVLSLKIVSFFAYGRTFLQKRVRAAAASLRGTAAV
jgi:hypothetical protein